MKINFATPYDNQSKEVKKLLTNKDFKEIKKLIIFQKQLTKAKENGIIKI